MFAAAEAPAPMSHAHREGPRAKDRPNVARSDVRDDVDIFLYPLALVGSHGDPALPIEDGRALNPRPLGYASFRLVAIRTGPEDHERGLEP